MTALRVLLFFPSITFNVMSAEVFPWATLYALPRIRVISFTAMAFLLIVLVSAMVAWADSGRLVFIEMIRSTAAYANPLLAFFVIMRCPFAEIERLVRALRIAFVLMFTVGLLQVTGIAVAFEGFLKLLIERAAGEEFGGGRGITVLATEPSRAAIELMFVHAALRMTTSMRPLTGAILDLLVALFVLFAVRSVAGVAFLGIFAVFHYPVLSLLAGAGLVAAASVFVDNRFFSLIADLFETGALDDAIFYLFANSGFRGVSVVSSYVHMLHQPLGAGVGNWEQSSVEAMRALGVSAEQISYFRSQEGGQFVGVRPAAFGANVALDMGIVGLVAFTLGLLSYVRRTFFRHRDLFTLGAMWFFYVFVMGSVGDPVPWVCLAMGYRWVSRTREQTAPPTLQPAFA